MGCSIFNEFTEAWGCEFYFDKSGEPVWPKLAINFTQKTQFFYRIAKGATKATDDAGVNKKRKDLRVPHRNIIYLGDGMTDIPAMTLVKHNGGRSIALYPETTQIEKVREIYTDEICNFICKADYSSGSDLDKVVKLIIDSISVSEELLKKEKALAKR